MAQRTLPRGGSGVGAVLLPGLVVALVVAVALTALTGAKTFTVLGLPDPGALTTYGLPVVTAAAECAAVLTVGSLLLAAFLVPPESSGYLDVAGFRAVRATTWFAGGWCVAAALMVPFSVADALGRPVGDVLALPVLTRVAPELSSAEAWATTALVALLVCVASGVVLSWCASVVLFALGLFGLVPVAVTGHSASGGAHDVATESLLLHVTAAALWVGGLVAVLGYAARRGEHTTLAVARFSRLALVCWAVMAASGTVNALVRVPLAALFTTLYGLLVVAKTLALLALGAIGYLQRERSIAAVRRGSSGALLRLGGFEVLVMFATIGLAVALSRTTPPVPEGPVPSTTEVLVGYPLDAAPTLGNLLFAWRFDLIFGSGAIAAAVLYLFAVRRLRRRGDNWATGRVVAWVSGCAVVLVATSSGIGRYAPAMFSVHMGSHMLLSMLAPILLVLGAPVTLALRALPPAGRDAPPGPREWLLTAVHSPLARVLAHPVVALGLFVGSFYGLYFSGLFDTALTSHWAHLAMNAHFLLVGTLFFWLIVGVDPAPRRWPPVGRLAMLFASIPFHAFFGIALMSSHTVIGEGFYRALALPWVPDLLADQRLGGGLAWASGEVPMLVVLVAVIVQWARLDERSARRADRRADADGDAELAAYNAMLGRLAGRPSPAGPVTGRTGATTGSAQAPESPGPRRGRTPDLTSGSGPA